MDVDQLGAVEVDFDVVASHVRSQAMPPARSDAYFHPLHFNAAAVLDVVPADVVLQGIGAGEVVVVLVPVAPHDAASAVHPPTHRLAPNRNTYVAERGTIRDRDWEPVVGAVAVLLGEHVGPARRIGR